MFKALNLKYLCCLLQLRLYHKRDLVEAARCGGASLMTSLTLIPESIMVNDLWSQLSLCDLDLIYGFLISLKRIRWRLPISISSSASQRQAYSPYASSKYSTFCK